MGIVAVKIKIMPESPDTDLLEIKAKTEKLIGVNGGKNCQISEEAIAFGLKALIALFAWDENKELEPMQEEIKKISGVNSCEVIDMRRAFG